MTLEKIKKNSQKNIKSILKSQQRFRSKKRNVFTEETNKITFSAHDDKTIQSIDSIETHDMEQAKTKHVKKTKLNDTK